MRNRENFLKGSRDGASKEKFFVQENFIDKEELESLAEGDLRPILLKNYNCSNDGE